MIIVVTMAGMALLIAVQLVRIISGTTSKRDDIGLQDAYEALVGYAGAHAMLPASDSGWLPRSLTGNARGNRLRYHVASAVTQVPSVVFSPSSNLAINSPGLNFCLSLAQIGPGAQIQVGSNGTGVPALAVLEYSSSGATADSASGVALPGSADAAMQSVQGRVARAISSPELFSALDCGERLSRAAAAARYVDISTDLLALAKLNTQHWKNAIQNGYAGQANAAVSVSRLNSWEALIIADMVILQIMHVGRMPWTIPAEFAYMGVVAGYTSTLIQIRAQRDVVNSTIDDWINRDLPALEIEAARAAATENSYAAALDDSRNELLRFASLGLSQ
ncbi:hypothetical protein [Pseudacidovorax intermedius]|nr:hypothetical protein [Pseudacidovorax intermedius]